MKVFQSIELDTSRMRPFLPAIYKWRIGRLPNSIFGANMAVSLDIVNLKTAKFECTFGRGCDGLCCQNGRPSVSLDERVTISGVLMRALPLMRPAAKSLVEKEGHLSKRTKLGEPMLRVVDGWCVFFNKGCVLHSIGREDGDSYQYKPMQCALFPLDRDDKGEWYIRQWNYKGEEWDVFCLNPKQSSMPAAESMKAEIEYAERMLDS